MCIRDRRRLDALQKRRREVQQRHLQLVREHVVEGGGARAAAGQAVGAQLVAQLLGERAERWKRLEVARPQRCDLEPLKVAAQPPAPDAAFADLLVNRAQNAAVEGRVGREADDADEVAVVQRRERLQVARPQRAGVLAAVLGVVARVPPLAAVGAGRALDEVHQRAVEIGLGLEADDAGHAARRERRGGALLPNIPR
eukprot:6178022-Prymnesium_polylepis.1